MKAESRHLARLVVLSILIPMVGAAKGDQWRTVAEKEAKFANGLATLQVRFGPEFASLVRDCVSGCDPIPYKMAGLNEAERKQVTLYADMLCKPWSDEWTKIFRACDRDPGPKWCEGDEEGEKHLQLHTYFDAVTASLGSATDPLFRFNLMAVVAVRLNDKVFRDFKESMVDAWMIPLVFEFMKGATTDEVMAIAKALDASAYGYSKAIAATFASYAEKTPEFTAGQREQLNKMAQHASAIR